MTFPMTVPRPLCGILRCVMPVSLNTMTPSDRRFHAQPNACAECGPFISLYINHREPFDTDDPVKKAADLIRQGQIVALKGLGGFHSGCRC